MNAQLLDGDILICRGNGLIAKGISPWNYTPEDVQNFLKKNKFDLIYKHGRTTD